MASRILIAVAGLFGLAVAAGGTQDPLARHDGRVLVDIRTPAEWRDTGVIEGAVLLTFFDERGRHDAPAFLAALDAALAERGSRAVTLICRSGNRTEQAMRFLRAQGYDVEHVEGGMIAALRAGRPTVPPS